MRLIRYFFVMLSLQAGAQTYVPFAGKWNAGDKKDFTAVWKTDGQIHYGLLDGEGNCSVNSITAKLGETGGKPVAMNFSGDNKDAIAIYNSATRNLSLFNDIFSRKPFFSRKVGKPGDQLFAGDWDGKGKDGFALYRPSENKIFFYKTYNAVSPFYSTIIDTKGIIVNGDWNGDGKDGFAVYKPSNGDFIFYQNITDTKPYQTIATGNTDCLPVSGDWDGDNKDGIGLFKKMEGGSYKFFLFNDLSPNDMDDNFEWNDNSEMYDMSKGRQIFYTERVPHTDIDGNPLSNYDPQRSFFPEGIYNIIPSKIPEIYSAGFNLGFLWSSYYPLTKETKDLLDATDNKFRTIVYFVEPGGRPFIGKFDLDNPKKDVIAISSINNTRIIALDTHGDDKINKEFRTGNNGDIPFTGKWENNAAVNQGDGYALYRPDAAKGSATIFFYKDVSADNNIESSKPFSSVTLAGAGASDIPLSGDWDGDGIDGYALYNPGTRVLSLYQTIKDNMPFTTIKVGDFGDMIVTGDWDGQGKYSFAMYRPSTKTFWFYKNITDKEAFKRIQITDAISGDIPISGDWNGDGKYGVGLYRTTPEMDKHTFLKYDTNGKLIDSTTFGNPLLAINPKKYIYGYYTFDEPTAGNGSLPKLQSIYDTYSNSTSQVFFHVDTHVVNPSDSRYNNYLKFSAIGKATDHDDYPVSDTNTMAKSVARIAKTITQARISSKENIPNWYVAQAFMQLHSQPGEQFYLPLPSQYKAMVYTAIVHGATGIFDFTYQNAALTGTLIQGISPDFNKDLWQEATFVNKELDKLKPFLLSKTPAETSDNNFTVFTKENPDPSIGETLPIRTLLKVNPEGDYILVAVNMTNQTFNAVIGLPQAISPANRKVKKLFEENGEIETEAGSINDVFQPFDVHIYKIAAADIRNK